jgi:hypothetical protein
MQLKNNQFTPMVISLVFLLVVFTYPDFYVINPLAAFSGWLTVLQFLFVSGWVLFVVVPPFTAVVKNQNRFSKGLEMLSLTLWPASWLSIHVMLGLTLRDPLLGYLGTFPILIFTDVLAPILYLLLKTTKHHT